MTGMGWPVDLWVVVAVVYVTMFALINIYVNRREEQFYQEHPDEELY